MSLRKNIEFLRRLPKIGGLERFRTFDPLNPDPAAQRTPLIESREFGSNPGDLRMFSFAPQGLAKNGALVVVLHGCTQTAAGYDVGAGWSTLARRYGFALLMPQQKVSNNANGCFNWFQPDDSGRDRGEALSIRQMIRFAIAKYGLDETRIFVTGLSAGGAMTSVMLASYPEVFAGGAIIAGLPFGVANNLQQALAAMHQAANHSARELGNLVRNASSHTGPWPKISIWHGSADRIVNPTNADDIVKQWLDVHGLPSSPMSEGIVDGYPRQLWWDESGRPLIECYEITGMAHGTPLGTGDQIDQCGAPGAFLIEAGISSSYHIANFFGLTAKVHAEHTDPSRQPAPTQPALEGEILSDAEADQRSAKRAGRRRVDIEGIITKALTAAGLMK
jgi:poly(hydroxyalkanoate) depolymerase family esterase